MNGAAAVAALTAEADVAPVLAALNGGGAETRIVGGAVRNALLGVPVSDIDLATTLAPQAVAARARKAGWKVVPTGIEHGTVTVIRHGRPFEVTTLREDVETDGRRAKVRFSDDFAGDALRRDFTVNAMSAGPDGVLHDYAGGREDLARRRIRFIGDAGQRIAEDYLRILRLFRFHAQYGHGPVDPDGYRAAIAARTGLDGLSRERVRQEMLKLLAAPGAAAAVTAMAEGGLLGRLLAGVDHRARLARLAPAGASGEGLLRLAALALSSAEDVARLRERLRLSNSETARLAAMSGLLDRFHDRAPPDEAETGRLLYREGVAAVIDADAVLAAEGRDALSAAARLARDWTIPGLPFRGTDLTRRGIARGPRIGAILAEAEEAWIAAGFPDDPATLATILEQAVARVAE